MMNKKNNIFSWTLPQKKSFPKCKNPGGENKKDWGCVRVEDEMEGMKKELAAARSQVKELKAENRALEKRLSDAKKLAAKCLEALN